MYDDENRNELDHSSRKEYNKDEINRDENSRQENSGKEINREEDSRNSDSYPNFTMRDPEERKRADEISYYSGGDTKRGITGDPGTGNQDFIRGVGQEYGQEPRYYRASSSHIPEEPVKNQKKKRGVASKVAGITAAALLFGVVSGGTMVGVNWVASQYGNSGTVAASEAETTKERTTLAESNKTANLGATQVVSAVSTDVSAIVEEAMPSVVAINNTMMMQSDTFFGSQVYEVPSSGSGIIVGKNDEELLIVTNNHVVEGSKELKVTFIDNNAISAGIKGTDSESDLAVIAVQIKDISADTLSKIKVASIGDSDSLKVGQGVIAIGNALGYGQSVTVGYVSALNREVQSDGQSAKTLLQTDAAINPGNSGGALLNMQGELIGINAAKYSSTEVEGMGYAIPISKAQVIIDELMNKKTRVQVEDGKQGYLGIQGTNIDELRSGELGMPKGIYIYKIVDGGAASQSDLKEKDIITKFDGQTVRTMEDLKEMLNYYEGGSTVVLTVQSIEGGEYMERTVEVTLGLVPTEETVN